MAKKDETFSELPFKRKALIPEHKSGYRIYRGVKDYVVVQAATAKEALELSGITDAYKIERHDMSSKSVVDESIFGQEAAPKAADATAQAAPIEEAAAQTQPAEPAESSES
ncbi:MAG: hypothetical protein SFT92_01930 [Rickettsiales bacterium]|nr:hypothetical protein [Rickettsiales bacterium]